MAPGSHTELPSIRRTRLPGRKASIVGDKAMSAAISWAIHWNQSPQPRSRLSSATSDTVARPPALARTAVSRNEHRSNHFNVVLRADERTGLPALFVYCHSAKDGCKGHGQRMLSFLSEAEADDVCADAGITLAAAGAEIGAWPGG